MDGHPDHADSAQNSPRPGCARTVLFSQRVTSAFCAAAGLSMVIRSHQFVPDGYKVPPPPPPCRVAARYVCVCVCVCVCMCVGSALCLGVAS